MDLLGYMIILYLRILSKKKKKKQVFHSGSIILFCHQYCSQGSFSLSVPLSISLSSPLSLPAAFLSFFHSLTLVISSYSPAAVRPTLFQQRHTPLIPGAGGSLSPQRNYLQKEKRKEKKNSHSRVNQTTVRFLGSGPTFQSVALKFPVLVHFIVTQLVQ